MAGGDEWIYVPSSCQEAAEEEKAPHTKNSDLDGGDVGGSQSPPAPATPPEATGALPSPDGDDEAAAATKATDSGGEDEESCSDDDCGSTYSSTEVNEYLSDIERTDDEDEGAADDAVAPLSRAVELDWDFAKGLLNLRIGKDGEAPTNAAAAADRGKAPVAENPRCCDEQTSCGVPACSGSGCFGSHDDRYGTDYGYNYYYSRYGYGDAYYGPEAGGYGYGSGYYGDVYPYAPPAPRYHPSLVYPRPPPAYGATMHNLMPSHVMPYLCNPAAAPYMYNSAAAPPPPYTYYHYAAPVPASRYGPAQPEPRR